MWTFDGTAGAFFNPASSARLTEKTTRAEKAMINAAIGLNAQLPACGS
jgi:hypothetical protein